MLNSKKISLQQTGNTKGAPVAGQKKGGNFSKVEEMYDNLLATGAAMKEMRNETDKARLEGVLVKREQQRLQEVPEVRSDSFITKMAKTYGGTAALTADRYIKA